MTSSPGPKFKQASAKCKAVVPEVVVTAYLQPTNLANWFSKLVTIGPAPEIQPDERHFKRYFWAFLGIMGFEIGIIRQCRIY